MKRERLVTDGPYRWVRHPLYLSMVVILVGAGIALGGLWGIVKTFLLFLPVLVYRARLEEGALPGKFGQEWDEYFRQTLFSHSDFMVIAGSGANEPSP